MSISLKVARATGSLRAGVRSQTSRHTTFPTISARRYASGTSHESSGNHTKSITAGVAGGLLVFLGGYGWYHFSGAKTAVNSVHQVSQYMNEAKNKVQESAPEPNEALAWLKQTSQSYAAFIPGAKQYVDAAFDDLDAIREKHGGEVDSIVKDTYEQLKKITENKGVNMAAAVEGWNVIQEALKKISSLAGDAMQNILDNHPQLKERIGGDVDSLKSMGERYGPEAKKQVEETWEQINSVLSKGIGINTVDELRKVVQERMDKLRQLRDDTFNEGMKEAQSYLDKSPKAKELIEQNKEYLKQGDLETLWKKVKDAADSGSTNDLESFIESSVDQVKQGVGKSGGQIQSYMDMIPGADEITTKLNRLYEIGEQHGKEAKDLLGSTIDEVKEILKRKEKEAENLAQNIQK